MDVSQRVFLKAMASVLLFIPFSSLAAPANDALRESLTLCASFDQGVNADYARGDAQLHGSMGRGKAHVVAPGLPATNTIRIAKGAGKFDDALQFTRKTEALVFYKGPKNVDYRETNWSGTISFWLKLDPEKDLEPGYCDPLQLTAGNWANGVFFAEFSKDETPRHFRFAMRPLERIYNPKNLGWEAIPAAERPMVQIEKPPFSREQWTHVVFTWENANTGSKNGIGRLYLNGAPSGEFKDWDLTVKWNPEQMVLNLGAAYVGLFDDLAIFDRALSASEVKMVNAAPKGVRTLLGR